MMRGQLTHDAVELACPPQSLDRGKGHMPWESYDIPNSEWTFPPRRSLLCLSTGVTACDQGQKGAVYPPGDSTAAHRQCARCSVQSSPPSAHDQWRGIGRNASGGRLAVNSDVATGDSR
jgi:hypothetical protein